MSTVLQRTDSHTACCLCPQALNLLTFILIFILYGVTFTDLTHMDGPIKTLDVAAHVMRHASQASSYATKLAFAQTAADRAAMRMALSEAVDDMVPDLKTLLYGGEFQAEVRWVLGQGLGFRLCRGAGIADAAV